MSYDIRRVAAIAAMLGSAMGGGAEVMAQPRRRSTAGASGARDPYRGPRGAAGSKLWRKASEGKLGLRW